MAEPEVPAKGASSRAAADFMVDLYDAGDDCRTKLGAVRTIVQPSK